jgi:hypothetical protein
VIYPHSALLTIKRNEVLMHASKQTLKHAEWKKPVTKYDSTYRKFPEWANYGTESRLVLATGKVKEMEGMESDG